MLVTGNTIGAVFALKNFGWTDKQEVTHIDENSVNTKEEYEAMKSEILSTISKLN